MLRRNLSAIIVLAWFISLAITGAAKATDTHSTSAGNEPPQALTARGLENLHTFAKLFGALGYFHPSDAVRTTVWEQFSIAGVQKVEGAKSPQELAAALRALFLPIAPTVRIYGTGTLPPPASPSLKPRKGRVLTGFRYQGYPFGNSHDIYQRELLWPLKQAQAPYRADLGGGVSVIVPLTLYRDTSGTLPHTAALQVKPDKPHGFVPSDNDRTTRLADVIYAWNVFQHFYPYFAVTPVDWPGELDKALRKAATDQDDLAFRETLYAMLSALHDGHGRVGFGGHAVYGLPLAWKWVEDLLVVTAVGPNVTGVGRGDVVVKIDKRNIDEAAQNAAALTSAATKQWQRLRVADVLATRPTNDPVAITVRHADGSTSEVVLTPAKRADPTVPDVSEAPPVEAAGEVKPGIWYVDLSRNDSKAVEALIPKLVAAKGVVFDLREYPANGAFQVMQHLSDHDMWVGRFLVPVYPRPDQQGAIYNDMSWAMSPAAPRFHGKIVFLCGGGTLSAGETLMTLVADYHLGEIVGEPTAGTNGNVILFQLPGGYRLAWTGMRVERLDGSRFMGVGIKPTVPEHPTLAGIRAGRDDVLKAGIAVAEGKERMPPTP